MPRAIKPKTTHIHTHRYGLNSYVKALTPSTIFRNRALKEVTKVK